MPPLLFLPLQILIFFTHRVHPQEEPMPLYCYGNSYTSPSPFESTLFRLIKDLTAAVPFSSSLYLTDNATVSFPPYKIFSLAQCRPDASARHCINCLRRSAAWVNLPVKGCDRTSSATVGFDLCFLRYSDQPFYDVPDFSVSWFAYNEQTSHDPLHFAPRAKDLLLRLAREAAAAVDKFAVGISSDERMSIYGMAWCTRDLSFLTCASCLLTVMDGLPVERIGARAAAVSCSVKYETFPFFNLSLVTSATSLVAVHGDGDNLTASIHGKGDDSKTKWILVICILAIALVLFFIIFILFIARVKFMSMVFPIKKRNIEHLRSNPCMFLELSTVRAATNDFAEENKLGEGGFGAVFRGKLRDGEEIAVKRLSKTSLQGIEELKNEVVFVSKLQHRNLVRLLGCCLEKEEKLIVNEYLPNKSLDKLLFAIIEQADSVMQSQVDWGSRYKIIEGVAQGLLYLHEDSGLSVIHCDLKASSILLDSSMNPKILHFGFAKIFGINKAQRKTSQIGGTFGYMAPEYAMYGLISTKSDVYSYGVLVLEIITGRRNRCNYEESDCLDLLTFVWYNWKHGQALQGLDQRLGDQYIPEQAMRCFQIALLCIQEEPTQRPSMSSLVIMLSTSVMLPEPLMPSFVCI